MTYPLFCNQENHEEIYPHFTFLNLNLYHPGLLCRKGNYEEVSNRAPANTNATQRTLYEAFCGILPVLGFYAATRAV
jgi:hypothetical protein